MKRSRQENDNKLTQLKQRKLTIDLDKLTTKNNYIISDLPIFKYFIILLY